MVARKAGRRGHDALKSRASKDYFGVNLGNVNAKAGKGSALSARHTRTREGNVGGRDEGTESPRTSRITPSNVVYLSRGGILVFDLN